MECVRKVLAGAQSLKSVAEEVLPRPAVEQMQGQAPDLAGEASGQREKAPPQGLGSNDLLAQADAGSPTGQVVGYHLHGQSVRVGGELSRGYMVESLTVLETKDGVLHLGMAAMVGQRLQDITLSVGDEGMVAELANNASLEPQVGFALCTMRRTDTTSSPLSKNVYVVSATSLAPSSRVWASRHPRAWL